MLYQLGSLFGYLSVVFYFLAIFNYLVKGINRKFGEKIKKQKSIYVYFKPTMSFIVKNHRIFGLLTFLFFLAHSIILFSLFGFNPTGFAAAMVLIVQMTLGGYGYKSKRRFKHWLAAHRSIAALLLVTVLVHYFIFY